MSSDKMNAYKKQKMYLRLSLRYIQPVEKVQRKLGFFLCMSYN